MAAWRESLHKLEALRFRCFLAMRARSRSRRSAGVRRAGLGLFNDLDVAVSVALGLGAVLAAMLLVADLRVFLALRVVLGGSWSAYQLGIGRSTSYSKVCPTTHLCGRT